MLHAEREALGEVRTRGWFSLAPHAQHSEDLGRGCVQRLAAQGQVVLRPLVAEVVDLLHSLLRQVQPEKPHARRAALAPHPNGVGEVGACQAVLDSVLPVVVEVGGADAPDADFVVLLRETEHTGGGHLLVLRDDVGQHVPEFVVLPVSTTPLVRVDVVAVVRGVLGVLLLAQLVEAAPAFRKAFVMANVLALLAAAIREPGREAFRLTGACSEVVPNDRELDCHLQLLLELVHSLLSTALADHVVVDGVGVGGTPYTREQLGAAELDAFSGVQREGSERCDRRLRGGGFSHLSDRLLQPALQVLVLARSLERQV